MTVPESWRGVAFNHATDSDNRIHADDVAQRYGFRGGLVPGVTVYAYLVTPALRAWGLAWLERGRADVVLRKPLYDGVKFDVNVQPEGPGASADGYRGEVVDADGVHCADGRVDAPGGAVEAPLRRGDPPAPPVDDVPDATRAALERLRETGLGSVEMTWPGRTDFARYTRDGGDVPALVRLEADGYAHPGYALGIANWALSRNVRLGPWIHVQSDVRNFAAIPRDSRLVAESRVTDLFERGGHEFVDLDVAVFLEPDRPALRASHRAIYRLAPPR